MRLVYFFLGCFMGALVWACAPIDEQHSNPITKSYVPQPLPDFDFPVGAPDAKGYYNAQPFGKNNHLGDDWNGVGGGNTDLGDTIYAAADGVCTESINYFGGWGKVAQILHGDSLTGPESLYGHMDQMWIKLGQTVKRGQPIGTIGTAEGIYLAHLHFEIRQRGGMELGGGYSADQRGYFDPTAFIRSHRPKK